MNVISNKCVIVLKSLSISFTNRPLEQLYNKALQMAIVPNQEISGAKSWLQGETVGVCSFYKRGGQPPL